MDLRSVVPALHIYIHTSLRVSGGFACWAMNKRAAVGTQVPRSSLLYRWGTVGENKVVWTKAGVPASRDRAGSGLFPTLTHRMGGNSGRAGCLTRFMTYDWTRRVFKVHHFFQKYSILVGRGAREGHARCGRPVWWPGRQGCRRMQAASWESQNQGLGGMA